MSQIALAVAWLQNESEDCTVVCCAFATACAYMDGDGGCSAKVDMVRRLAGCVERILEVLPTTCDLCRAACDSFEKADEDMTRSRR